MKYININTWYDPGDGIPHYSADNAVGIGDDIKIESITVSQNAPVDYTVVFTMGKFTGAALDSGDVSTITLDARISNQDSFPRTDPNVMGGGFSAALAGEDYRLNSELVSEGQINPLTLVVYAIPESEEPVPNVLWNITRWTNLEVAIAEGGEGEGEGEGE